MIYSRITDIKKTKKPEAFYDIDNRVKNFYVRKHPRKL